LQSIGATVATGQFGAEMKIGAALAGPVAILLEF